MIILAIYLSALVAWLVYELKWLNIPLPGRHLPRQESTLGAEAAVHSQLHRSWMVEVIA